MFYFKSKRSFWKSVKIIDYLIFILYRKVSLLNVLLEKREKVKSR